MAQKKVVRVYFMDDSCRAFGIEETTSAEQLKSIIVERIEMKEDSTFAIFERKEGWERCLDPEDKPCELMASWTVSAEPKPSTSGPRDSLRDAVCCFLFKKRIFLRDDEREMQDSVAKHYVYLQALWSVIESEYPCGVDDAVRLAGLQVQIVYGDHRPSAHTVGFLTNNIRQFIPKDLFPTKRPGEWEAMIFKAHAMNASKSAEDAKTEYLDIVKQWPYYGTTFYPPCKVVANPRNLPKLVVIGVNAEGILLLKREKQELISTHPFTEICSWASSSTTFAFEFGSQPDAVKYTFDTKQGAIIASTIQTYIDILVQMLKNNSSEEEAEEEKL